jgi:hypothetical protein
MEVVTKRLEIAEKGFEVLSCKCETFIQWLLASVSFVHIKIRSLYYIACKKTTLMLRTMCVEKDYK